MIALSRTRGFSAGNWQILLINKNLNAAPDLAVSMALTFLWGGADSQVLLGKPILYGVGYDSEAMVQDATSAMNRVNGTAHFMREGNEGLTPHLDFIQIHIVRCLAVHC